MQPTAPEPSQHFIRAHAVCTAMIRAAKAGGTPDQDALLETARAEIAAYNAFINEHGQNDEEVWKGQKAAEAECGSKLKPFFRDTGLTLGVLQSDPISILASIKGTDRRTVGWQQHQSGRG
ncbi:MAG: hypothetical protein J0M34_04940 [Alphaproteobacteria bacterium]|nr:hypothetical protein [Alphaproteobacteria bacterium]